MEKLWWILAFGFIQNPPYKINSTFQRFSPRARQKFHNLVHEQGSGNRLFDLKCDRISGWFTFEKNSHVVPMTLVENASCVSRTFQQEVVTVVAYLSTITRMFEQHESQNDTSRRVQWNIASRLPRILSHRVKIC